MVLDTRLMEERCLSNIMVIDLEVLSHQISIIQYSIL